jgi:hypothetical protein
MLLVVILMMCGLFCLAAIHLLNSNTPAGDLARQFVRSVTLRVVHGKELPSDGDEDAVPSKKKTSA